jgi:hypothetical protein
MIQWEILSIMDVLYQDNRCQEADPEHGLMCIEVQFNSMDSFLTVGMAWSVLIVGSRLAMVLTGGAYAKSHSLEQE